VGLPAQCGFGDQELESPAVVVEDLLPLDPGTERSAHVVALASGGVRDREYPSRVLGSF
jgi:hypothetical protein